MAVGAVRIAQRRLGEAVSSIRVRRTLSKSAKAFDLLARVIEGHQNMAHGAGFRPAERLRMLAVVTLGVSSLASLVLLATCSSSASTRKSRNTASARAGLVQPDGAQLGGQFFGAGVTRGERIQPRVQLGVAHLHVFRFVVG